MSIVLRIVLIVAAVGLVAFMLWNIRKSKLRIEDALFWTLLSVLILVLSIFPEIASFFSSAMGFQAPVNFIFLFFIFVLLVHSYFSSKKISQLEMKLKELTQRIALDRAADSSEDAVSESAARETSVDHSADREVK